ncbi:MAG: type II secretion system F family protein [Pirellulaceae bacterium]|nr:type II secretion system F family protein [Pirellulaceae bacterium]
MTPTILIAITAGICVAALIGSLALMFQGEAGLAAEDRLSALTSRKSRDAGVEAEVSILNHPLNATKSAIEVWVDQTFNLQRLFDQADFRLPVVKFVTLCGGAAAIVFVGMLMSGLPYFFAPVAVVIVLVLPYVYLVIRKNKRIQKFNKQLPEALELLGRSLLAGHSLGAGFGLVAAEMPQPIRGEFGRCFEEQKFGISLEESLNAMTERIPNMDLRFLATAIILQRQTGGDLAEILDKIGRLIRERFKLAGQIQALTGEGRLSGIVLLALPLFLFVVMYFLNREYILSLFKDELGRKLLGGAIVMQFVGALVIRKIVDIKV